jgi:hypothetical protein
MIFLLADHDIEGHAHSLIGILDAEGWLDMEKHSGRSRIYIPFR